MNSRRHARLTALIVLACVANMASAASVFITPATSTAVPGQSRSLEVWMDFDEIILGGALDVVFDPEVLTFESWTAEALGNPDFLTEPHTLDGRINGIAFGDFQTGITGQMLIGTIAFAVSQNAGIGLTSVIPGPVFGCACGPDFVEFGTFFALSPDYAGADVSTVVSNVPAPAALWLLSGGLVALAGFFRCR